MRRIWFHLSGAVVMTLATAFAGYVTFFAFWGATVCGEDPTEARRVWGLRFGLVLIGVVLAAVPGTLAWWARRTDRAWKPWAGIATAIIAGAVVWAATIDSVGEWCLY